MATPPENDDANHSNAPLNFRHSNSLITTKVPHYPTKLTTGMSIIPGWNRPNANGQNANINDKDYNGPNFKARPLKHWRKQLQVYNYNGPANNSRTATISELDRPGTTVYHFTPDCSCVPDEGGNSYIISNNKFGYEVKDNKYSKEDLDVKVQNNGFTIVPYDATTAQINDPTNQSAYKIMTGIYNTNCINCSPQGNIIRSGIAFQSQAFFSYSNDKLETRCQTYEQNISTNKEPGCVYFDAQGIPLWPTDTRNGPQVVAPVNYQPTRLFNKPCLSETIYKPSNIAFAKQGAVSGATRLRKLVSDTTMMNGSSFYSARGAEEANLGRFQGTNLSSNYYVKTKPVVDSCRGRLPTPPILSVINRDTYSITFTWQELGNSICKVAYYTVTYFAINIVERLRDIDDSQYFFNSSEGDQSVQSVENIQDFLDNYNEIEFYNNENIDNTETMIMGTKNGIVDSETVYTDRENNIRYNIISEIRTKNVAPSTTTALNIPNISDITKLNPNTRYLMSMTSTNGNGTSIRSNVVLSSTLLDSNIVISIEPVTTEINGNNYVYTYNAYEPIVLTIRVSSEHSTTPIILSIINATNSNIATIIPVEGSSNTYRVRFENSGTFNLQGLQARGLGEPNSKFGNSITTSPLLTINRATPTFNPTWNPIPTVFFTGDVVTFTPPIITFPVPVPDEILPITYSYESATAGIITITQLNTIAVTNVGNTSSVTTTTMLISTGSGDFPLNEFSTILFSPNNVVNTIRVIIPNGISVVPYLYENVSAYGQNPAGAGLNLIRNCSVYSPSDVGTSIIPDTFLSLFFTPSFTYNDMIITPANTNACGVGTNPILHYIDLWLPSNQLLTLNIQIFEGSNLVPSATYRRDSITTGGATATFTGQPMLPFRIYASDIVSAQGVSENYIRPFNSGALQFRIRITLTINNFFSAIPIRQQFSNMPIMTVNMSSTDNIISNNSGITNQITTNFTDIKVTNNTSYRFGFLPLGITNPNQVWIQTGTLSFGGFTISRYAYSLENFVSSVTINSIGSFRIRATTRLSDRYESTDFYSHEYAVTPPRMIPTFNPTWNPIPTVLVTGDAVTLTSPEFTFPAAPVPAEILPITYSYESATAGIITITQPTITQPSLTLNVTINNIGSFRIRATTRLSNRYESVFIDSLEYSVTPPQTVTFTGTVNFETIYVDSLNVVVTGPVLNGFTIYRVTSTSAGASYVINSNLLSTSVSFLIVGGGGGSGNFNSASFGGQFAVSTGGGGGGGFIESSGTTNSNTQYSIYVGRGGVGNSFDSTGNGENSLLQLSSGTLTAIGGGRGGNHGTNLNGLDGGSGGGGGRRVFIVGQVGVGGSGTPGQGFPGAPGTEGFGSGGGAGGDGISNSRNGGVGLSSTITGQSIFYAGGGGGAGRLGGIGGGGHGFGNGLFGTNGLGGGGGGIREGGTGVVILRIPSFI